MRYLPLTKEEVNAIAGICLYVCLLARLLKNAWMDLDEMLHLSTDVGTWRNWLTIEPDPDHSPDAGTGKSEIESEIRSRSNRHLAQIRLQVTGCTAERYCLLDICSPRVREFPRSAQLFCTTYGCGATGRQSCPIFGFSSTKCLKCTFRWSAYNRAVTSQNDYDFLMW